MRSSIESNSKRPSNISGKLVDISVRAGASRSEARARLALGAVLVRVGSVTEAIAQAKAAFDYYNQTGFLAQRSRALTVIAQGQERTGDLAGAEASYEALLKDSSRRR